MSWQQHVKAFYASWAIRYLHPGSADWKNVWDHILLLDDRGENRYFQGRGVLIGKLNKKDKKRILRTIPKTCVYMRTCIQAFWDMDIRQDIKPDIKAGEIHGEPLRYNWRFETPITGLQLRYWANVLDTGLIGDLVDKDTDDLYYSDVPNWKAIGMTKWGRKLRRKLVLINNANVYLQIKGEVLSNVLLRKLNLKKSTERHFQSLKNQNNDRNVHWVVVVVDQT